MINLYSPAFQLSKSVEKVDRRRLPYFVGALALVPRRRRQLRCHGTMPNEWFVSVMDPDPRFAKTWHCLAATAGVKVLATACNSQVKFDAFTAAVLIDARQSMAWPAAS